MDSTTFEEKLSKGMYYTDEYFTKDTTTTNIDVPDFNEEISKLENEEEYRLYSSEALQVV